MGHGPEEVPNCREVDRGKCGAGILMNEESGYSLKTV
jgi:hypothetical protein